MMTLQAAMDTARLDARRNGCRVGQFEQVGSDYSAPVYDEHDEHLCDVVLQAVGPDDYELALQVDTASQGTEPDTADPAVDAVRNLAHAFKVLHATGIIRSRRYIGDLGEWYIERLYGGVRAAGPTQKGWDVQLPTGERLQVKTRSYSPTTWDYMDADLAHFDRLVLVRLTDDFTVRDLYEVPVGALVPPLLRVSHEKAGDRQTFHWKDLAPWRVRPNTLPGYEALRELTEPTDM
jgi:hypothetical protein